MVKGEIFMKKTIFSVLSTLVGVGIGMISGAAIEKNNSHKEEKKWKQLADKHLALMQLFNQWMVTKQEGKSIVDYFHKESIKSIAIYGMSYVGERLYDELKDSDIEVKYAIDKNADGIYSDVEIVTPQEELKEVDAIVVTPVFYFDEIVEALEKKTESEVLSLEDILYEL